VATVHGVTLQGFSAAVFSRRFSSSKCKPLNSKQINVGLLEPRVQLFVNTENLTAFAGCGRGGLLGSYEVIRETLRGPILALTAVRGMK